MTNRIDRLAARGLVERHPSLDDRRSVMVQLTDAGAAKVDAALIDLLAHERNILAGLGPDDADLLASLLRRVLTPFDHPSPA
jgi:DNA-binding MarR family transcriptional regulator